MPHKLKILIVGASSFIGRRLYSYLESKDYDLYGTYFSNKTHPDLLSLDITNKDSISSFFKDKEFDVIVWMSAHKNVSQCEKNPDECLHVNSKSLDFVLSELSPQRVDSRFIFISSDHVFDGKEGDYYEDSPTSPKTVYGQSKLLAEKKVLSFKSGLVLRTGAVMGKGGGFFDFLIGKLLQGESVSLFENTFVSPTSIHQLIKGIEKLATDKLSLDKRVYHLSSGAKMSRYELGVKLNERHPKLQRSEITPDSLNLNESLFHYDLSLRPSDFFSDLKEDIIEELSLEVDHYA